MDTVPVDFESDASNSDIKLFTHEQANRALPLIRMIVRDIMELTRSMIERRERIHLLKNVQTSVQNDVYSEELEAVEQSLEDDARRLKDLVYELASLGVALKSIPEGLVDFPAMRDGRLVYLCWKYDEPEVSYWHEQNEGFSERQEIPTSRIPDNHFPTQAPDHKLN